MADRTISRTKERIISLLTRVPQGVPRASLHGVTGETTLIHQALQELIDEGVVTERLITTVRGKPRREYCLAQFAKSLGLQSVESPSRAGDELLPGAKAIVENIVNQYPGASRSELWSKAVVTKSWVSHALDELVREGKIIEILEEDMRGGLRRRYAPASAAEKDSPSAPRAAKVRAAS